MNNAAAPYLTDLFGLHGRTALITGGSSGIGYAIARALGGAGAHITIAARRQTHLDQALTRLHAHGVTATAVQADMGDPDDITRLCETVPDTDILVTSAANNIRHPMGELTPGDYEQTIAVNLTAPYRLGQHHAPRMARRGWGRIINIGSQQTHRAFGNSGAYGVAKAAIGGLSRSQAEAWSPHGVTANTILPGFVLTPLTEAVQAIPGRVEALAARHAIGRNGLPDDYAGIAVFLASDAAAFVTGQNICVDGGFSIT
ncbi:SDR family oxidoreductase [Herbidospora sp. NEAU-GS84]|uniref:SDR family oxidoreductase n=1 Tax=Herbidospora solisilvae TaxID=2696284 RepID=A0A7C9J950_9ACTN|nr:SDR family oxidoreductase [Herbidospora solisilvae]NAS20184.1 SDR family oxidoreductase [Herbidospora solisilvae]